MWFVSISGGRRQTGTGIDFNLPSINRPNKCSQVDSVPDAVAADPDCWIMTTP